MSSSRNLIHAGPAGAVLVCEQPLPDSLSTGPLVVEGIAAAACRIDHVEIEVAGIGCWTALWPVSRPDLRRRLAGFSTAYASQGGFRLVVPTDDWAPGEFDLCVRARSGSTTLVTQASRIRWAPSDSHGFPPGPGSFVSDLRAGRMVLWWGSPCTGEMPTGRFVPVAGWAASPAGISAVEVQCGPYHHSAHLVDPGRLAQRLRHLIDPAGIVGYAMTLDLAEVDPGDVPLRVIARGEDGRSRARIGRLRVAPTERLRRWLEREHDHERAALVAHGPQQPIRVLMLPAPANEPLRLPAALSEQTHRTWEVQATAAAALQLDGELIEPSLSARRIADAADLADALEVAVEPVPCGPLLVVTLAHDLAPEALARIAGRWARQPQPDLVYCDERQLDADGEAVGLWLKPGWSPELLLQHDYVGTMVAIGPAAARAVLAGASRPASVYEALLQLVDEPIRAQRIPQVLAGCGGRSHRPGGLALGQVAARRGRDAEVAELPGGRRRLRWPLAVKPMVSVVIPTTGDRRVLEPCLRSLRATAYAPLEVVLVDSGTGRAATVAARALDGIAHRVVPYAAPPSAEGFNFSRACELGAADAAGALLLFLNDDVTAIDPWWLEAMVEQVTLPGVGVVGARLEWPDGLVQHCGLALRGVGAGPPGTPYEIFAGLPAESDGPDGLLVHPHECAAVTGACLLISRELLSRVGGWDGRFRGDYGDFDLCLKVWEAGLRVLVLPAARLRHEQSATRIALPEPATLRRFRQRWAHAFPDGDGWHHPAYGSLRDGVLSLAEDAF